MPNFYDFSKIKNVNEVQINPVGWVNPLTIEYGIGDYSDISCFWRIKGTEHTFVILVKRLDYISKGEYDKHFEEVLAAFREDYISWAREGFYAKWMQDYRDQYGKYVLV